MPRLSDLIRDQAPAQKNGGPATPHVSASSLDTDQAWIHSAKQEIAQIKEAIRSNLPLQLKGCVDLAKQLVQRLHRNDELIRWALDGQTKDYVLDNAVHVAVLGTKVGMGMQYSDEDLERLALAGLLHDIGMWTLPMSLLEKGGALSEEERDILRTHPERGRRIIATHGSVFEWVSTISAQEHERWDGSGYPCRLKGKQIAEHAQIIGLVDTVDAMVTTRPYRTNVTPHQAVRELLVNAKTIFPLRVLKALGDQITLYPVGTSVRLNTGEIGAVVKPNSRYPLRPVVAISKLGETSELDLSQVTSAYIVEVLATRIAS